MKFISWNVNGFRAILNKGFANFFNDIDADFFALQETKMQVSQLTFHPEDYREFFNSAIRKGYSGTGVFTKFEPVSVSYGINGDHNDEGRVITLEYENFYFITCYAPNSKDGLARISYRMEFEDAMRDYLISLDNNKPIIYTGDLNVAHMEIDLKNPKSNRGNAGFSDEERSKLTELLDSGFIDTFRYMHPDKTGIYSWWSYRFNARKNNAGWRIDYFIISDRIKDKIKTAGILTDVMGSDHAPVVLEIEL